MTGRPDIAETLAFRDELVSLLNNLRDEGTGIDTGSGYGVGDIWVTVGGTEFFIQVQRSRYQAFKDRAVS